MSRADGTRVECEAGLMAGCLPGRSCVAPGQCLAPGEQPTACLRDVDCPDFQACLGGYCAPNCQSSSDCQAGATCYRRVCRKQCNLAGTALCSKGFSCTSIDGKDGVCTMDAGNPRPESAAPPPALSVSRESLPLTSNAPSQDTRVRNTGQVPVAVIVRKREEHSIIAATGSPQTRTLEVSDVHPSKDAATCTQGSLGCSCGPADSCNSYRSGLALVCEADASKT
jgi:hypothetical protein